MILMSNTIQLSDLSHFTGSEVAYYHPMFKAIKYTEGVQFVGANGASWLVTDILAVAIFEPKVKREEFVLVTFTAKGGSGLIMWDDGNGKVLHHQDVPMTDFPDGKIKFYIENGMMMLPSER